MFRHIEAKISEHRAQLRGASGSRGRAKLLGCLEAECSTSEDECCDRPVEMGGRVGERHEMSTRADWKGLEEAVDGLQPGGVTVECCVPAGEGGLATDEQRS